MRRQCEDVGEGITFWFVVGQWFASKKALVDMPSTEAVGMIRTRFDVSRATAYRWLKAWREVNPASLFSNTNKGSQL